MIIVNKGADYSALGLGRAFLPEDQISSEVKNIMAHYSAADTVMASALQEFFNSIGSTLKAKLRSMILPIFASNTDEALYDIIKDNILSPISGSGDNRLVLNSGVKRVRVTGSAAAYPTLYYALNDVENAYTANLIIASSNFIDNTCQFLGCNVSLNDAAVIAFRPTTTNNKKIIGGGLVDDNDTKSIIRLADTETGDRITAMTSAPAYWNTNCACFGLAEKENTSIGTRIFVCSDQLLSVAEAKTIRDAVKALDDKFFG